MQQEKRETPSSSFSAEEEASSSKQTLPSQIQFISPRSQPFKKRRRQYSLDQQKLHFSLTKSEADEDSPPDPVRAMVLLFYRPPGDLDPTSFLNVLMLPRNVSIDDVVRYRKKIVGDEHYISIPPDCKLQPQQEYTLSTCPEDDSVLVEPKTAEFDSDHYNNFLPSFQVTLRKTMNHLKLNVRDTKSSQSVWEGRVCLSSSGAQRSCGQSAPNLSSDKRLFEIRSRFIKEVSGPVLNSLLLKLLERKVTNDSEVETAAKNKSRGDKARFVIDTVRRKGEAASSEMIKALCELDFFTKYLPKPETPKLNLGGADPLQKQSPGDSKYDVPGLTRYACFSESLGAGSNYSSRRGKIKRLAHSLRQQTQEEPRPAEHPLSVDSDPEQTSDSFQGTREDSSDSSVSPLSEETDPVFYRTDDVSSVSSCDSDYSSNFKSINSIQGSQDQSSDLQISSPVTERSRVEAERSSVHSEAESGGDSDSEVKLDADVTAVSCSLTNTLPTQAPVQTFSSGASWTEGLSGSLPRSHSSPSLSHVTSAENNTLTPAQSLPDLQLNSSCEQFTPDITADEDHETYRFQCSSPGLYQCSMTGLVFHMEREGDVVYRTVPWNRKLLSQHHKQPAGPLFDIKCEQQSVCQLHLPHCEILSTGGADFLSVAHLDEESTEFMVPHKITETHVIINITGFSAFGNVKDEDSPPDPVRAMVLLFYRPPADPDPTSLLNVLMLPGNVLIPDVVRYRKKLIGDEHYIENSSYCKLQPQQEYTLSTCPEDDSVLVEPTTAEFDSDHYNNFVPSFQMYLKKNMTHLKLILRDTKSSHSVWERHVFLSFLLSGVQRSCGQSALSLPPNKRLFEIRSRFIKEVSGPVLKSLLDRLLEKTVMTDSEVETMDQIKNRGDKARSVIDTVRRKGEAASSEMIEALCELDPYYSEHLGLM